MHASRLICFPFAGGNRMAFQGLRAHLRPSIELIGLDYPGHGSRLREKALSHPDALLGDLMKQIQPLATGRFAFYGHSLGALMAYLATRRLLSEGQVAPAHLFVSGRNGPAWKDPSPDPIHLLPREAFVQRLEELGGTPKEVLASEELMHFFEPILRADFAIGHNYVHVPATPMDIPITAFAGAAEPDTDESTMRQWQAETSFPLRLNWFPGGHFFIFDHWAELGARIVF